MRSLDCNRLVLISLLLVERPDELLAPNIRLWHFLCLICSIWRDRLNIRNGRYYFHVYLYSLQEYIFVQILVVIVNKYSRLVHW